MKPTYIILGVLLLAVSGLCIGVASASHSSDVFDHTQEATQYSYSEAALEQNQPKLVTDNLDVKPLEMYGYKVSSSRFPEEDVYAYWTRYSVQTGYSAGDSHLGDREPIYVFVDTDTGEITRISYTQYHWLKDTVSIDDVATDDAGRPIFHVAEPHHHYSPVSPTTEDVRSEQLNLRPFINASDPSNSAVQAWYDNGWTDGDYDVIMNPHEIQYQQSWWSDDGVMNVRASTWYWDWRLSISETVDSVTETFKFW